MESVAYKDASGGGRGIGAVRRGRGHPAPLGAHFGRCQRKPLPGLVLIGHWRATTAMVESNDTGSSASVGICQNERSDTLQPAISSHAADGQSHRTAARTSV